jgi:ADP-ribosylglycohydrolase
MAGLAVGNVLGLAVESRSREAVQASLGAKGPFIRLPVEEATRDWDDDLAMAMALGECLARLPEDAARLDLQTHLEAYLGWLRSGARGIGGLTREVLIKTLAGEARAAERVWQARCDRGERPLGNGAAMRIAPLGLAFAGQPGLIAALAADEAALTHRDPACRQSAGLIALMAAALVRQERAPSLFVLSHAGPLLPEVSAALIPLSLDSLAARRIDGPDMGSTLLALQVAVSILTSGLPYAEALPWVIRQGGDTDTNGAIVGALLGARDGWVAIPQDWRACVAQGDRILDLGRRLLRRSGLQVQEVTR